MAVERTINTLVIHCAATPNGRWTTVEDIDGWHRDRGFRRLPTLIGFNQPRLRHIGYHFVVYISGAVATGRGLREVGAHARGHNETSIGICLVGTDRFTAAQWSALRDFVTGITIKYPGMKVMGHNEVSKKSCPGFDVQAWLVRGMKPEPENILEDVR